LGGISQLSAMKNLEEMFSGDWQQEREEEDGEQLLDSALENVNFRWENLEYWRDIVDLSKKY
jgi:hypothetical protein